MNYLFRREKMNKKTHRLSKQQSMLTKVINQFGLKVENSKIIPITELKRKHELALEGWKKVRNTINAVRFTKNLHLLNQHHKRCSYQTLLIYPQSKLKTFVNILQSIIIIYNIIIVPYRFLFMKFNQFRYAFDKVYNQIFILTDIIGDTLYIFVIIAHFFFVKTRKTQYITNFQEIACRYMMQLFRKLCYLRGLFKLESDGFFFVDAASIFPYYLYNDLYWLRFFRFLQLSVAVKGYTLFWRKVMKNVQLIFSQLGFSHLISILQEVLQIFQDFCCSSFFQLNVLHAFGIFQVIRQQIDVPEGIDNGEIIYLNGWVNDILYQKDPNADQYTEYITAIYWVFTTLTTVGYGDYHGETTYELIFTMLVEFIGVFVFAYMMGNINMLVEKLDHNHLEYLEMENEQLDEWLIKIGRANESRKLSGAFIEELRHRLNLYWQQDHSQLSIQPFFQQLPFKLQSELIEFCFGGFIADFSSFFRGLEIPFMHYIVTSLYPKQFLVKNGEKNIIRAGSTANELFFITKGKVAVTTTVGEKFLLLPELSYFGDYLIMFNIKSSNYFCTFNEDIECMCISKERFLQICNIYPYSKKVVQYKAYARRQYIQNVKKNFMKMREEHKIRQGTFVRRSVGNRYLGFPQTNIQKQVDDEEILKISRTLLNRIEELKITISSVEKLMKEKICQIRMDIEYVTKFEEIAQQMSNN